MKIAFSHMYILALLHTDNIMGPAKKKKAKAGHVPFSTEREYTWTSPRRLMVSHHTRNLPVYEIEHHRLLGSSDTCTIIAEWIHRRLSEGAHSRETWSSCSTLTLSISSNLLLWGIRYYSKGQGRSPNAVIK